MTTATDLVLEGLEGERDKTILAMVIARAWRDADYRGHLLADPKAVLVSEGLAFSADVKIEILENTPTITYVNIARDTSEATSLIPILERLVPVQPGHEVRLVQSTEEKRYFVIPVIPEGLEITLTSEADLSEAAARVIRNFTYVFVDIVQVQSAAAATTVVAAAEVVAVIVVS
jgi:hypothetical protein